MDIRIALMGMAFYELIPPAILLDNPGLTKEQFAEKLAETHEFSGKRTKNAPWDRHRKVYSPIFDKYHQRLRGLAQVLKLEETLAYQEMTRTPVLNSQGKLVWPPRLEIDYGYNPKTHVIYPHFWVIEPKGYQFGKDHIVTLDRWGVLQKKDIVNILEEDNLPELEESDWQFAVKKRFYYRHLDYLKRNKVLLCEFKTKQKTYKYKTEEDLYKDWPRFHPEARYDFSKESGSFKVEIWDNKYWWIQKDGRYYLDPKTFELIPPSISSARELFYNSVLDRCKNLDKPLKYKTQQPMLCDKHQRMFSKYSGPGYTDLILAAEAIKNRAWKLLAYGGWEFVDDFLQDFPESAKRYERATLIAQSAWDARITGKSNTEFLRNQLIMGTDLGRWIDIHGN